MPSDQPEESEPPSPEFTTAVELLPRIEFQYQCLKWLRKNVHPEAEALQRQARALDITKDVLAVNLIAAGENYFRHIQDGPGRATMQTLGSYICETNLGQKLLGFEGGGAFLFEFHRIGGSVSDTLMGNVYAQQGGFRRLLSALRSEPRPKHLDTVTGDFTIQTWTGFRLANAVYWQGLVMYSKVSENKRLYAEMGKWQRFVSLFAAESLISLDLSYYYGEYDPASDRRSSLEHFLADLIPCFKNAPPTFKDRATQACKTLSWEGFDDLRPLIENIVVGGAFGINRGVFYSIPPEPETVQEVSRTVAAPQAQSPQFTEEDIESVSERAEFADDLNTGLSQEEALREPGAEIAKYQSTGYQVQTEPGQGDSNPTIGVYPAHPLRPAPAASPGRRTIVRVVATSSHVEANVKEDGEITEVQIIVNGVSSDPISQTTRSLNADGSSGSATSAYVEQDRSNLEQIWPMTERAVRKLEQCRRAMDGVRGSEGDEARQIVVLQLEECERAVRDQRDKILRIAKVGHALFDSLNGKSSQKASTVSMLDASVPLLLKDSPPFRKIFAEVFAGRTYLRNVGLGESFNPLMEGDSAKSSSSVQDL